MTETVRPTSNLGVGVEVEGMAPPRNDGVPETSISGDASVVQGQQQGQTSWPPVTPWSRMGVGSHGGSQTAGGAVSETEGEAQKSLPTAQGLAASPTTSPTQSQTQTQTQPPAPTTTPPPPKKSKLRPRKAPITLTPLAVSQLRALHTTPSPKLIRVGVKNRGCSGLAYHLEYVDKPGAFDEQVEQDGVKVLIDSKALFSIIGSEMDWVEEKLAARFVFRNPNISEFLAVLLLLVFM